MRNRMIFIILILIVFIGVITIHLWKKSELKQSKDNEYKEMFYKDLTNVTYIELFGPSVSKTLDNTLANMIIKYHEKQNGYAELSQKKNDNMGLGGEMAYCYYFYDNNNNNLSWIQYYGSNEKIFIVKEIDNNYTFIFNIDDEEILEYIKDTIELARQEGINQQNNK